MKSPPLISLAGVSVRRLRPPEITVLTDINWEVSAGVCWIIAGLQGSGKTLLLETAAGLHPISAGEVRLFGELVSLSAPDHSAQLRQRLGLVFDGTGRLFPSLSVLENVLLPVQYHRNLGPSEALESVADILQTLELESIANQRPGRLPRAWARRVALARALALRPDVLLLDNPLSGLDPSHIRWWRSLLGQFVSGHPLFGGVPRTVIISSDDLRPLLSLGQQFALAHQGGWRLLGNREAVSASTDPFIHDLLNSVE